MTDAWLGWISSDGVKMGSLLLLGFINQCRDERIQRIVGLLSYDEEYEVKTRQFYIDNGFEIKEFNGTEYVVYEF